MVVSSYDNEMLCELMIIKLSSSVRKSIILRSLFIYLIIVVKQFIENDSSFCVDIDKYSY